MFASFVMVSFLCFPSLSSLRRLWRKEPHHPIRAKGEENEEEIRFHRLEERKKAKEHEIKLHSSHSMKVEREDNVKIEIQGILTQEMIRDILIWLPVKSLIRFNSLSKGFKSLLRSSNFIVEHLDSSKRSPFLLLDFIHYSRSMMYSFSTFHLLPSASLSLVGGPTKLTHLDEQPFSIVDNLVQIVGSSNGLLCVTTKIYILIWNPATKQVRRIPEPNSIMRSFACCSFGFTSVVNDYKVVIVHHNVTPGAEVYSLRSGTWKRVDVGAYSRLGLHNASHYSYDINTLVTANGSCFGVVSEFNVHGNFPKWIICFDLGMETFTKINLPSLLANNVHVRLEPYKDSIALLVHHLQSMGDVADIWVYIKGEDCWTKVYSVPDKSYNVRGVWRDEVIIIEQEESENKALIGLSNGEKNKILATHESHMSSTFRLFKAYDYVESLVLI